MRSLNPFVNIPTIMTAEAIIEFAHLRSVRTSMKSSKEIKKVERARIREIARLQEFVKNVKIKLKLAVEEFPSLDRLHPFYLELTEVLVGTDRLKQALGAVYNCIPPINEIADNHLQALKLAEEYKQFKRLRSAAKGRIASIVKATAKNLDFIIEAKKKMARLPGILPGSPTVVCAGFPNVGKSTLVKSVSTAEPEIAYYPFTTRKVIVGHLKVDNQSVQIVDTPGLLDRPMSKRNEIELEAIAALKYLAHVIIFMIDPSEACGWPLNEQFQLYEEICRMFPLVPILVTFNKVDIAPPENLANARARMPNAHEIIAVEGTGVAELMKLAVEEVDLTSIKEQVDEYVASLSEREFHSFDS
ncbi:MAG: GTPase [Candidatus Thorarchaeota archaeon]